MKYQDTACLTKEVGKGIDMAIYSFDQLLERVKDPALKKVITESRNDHKRLQDENNNLQKAYHVMKQEPGSMAKGMAWMETNMKLSMEDSDRVVADIITKGCDTGVKNLYKYINEYAESDLAAVETARKLIDIEETLEENLRLYL
ncbi:MAG: hypothetical protein Q4C25_07015 [Bacillota bacterium]|nr:hypothetical protein [Bacillota bacterium]